MAVHSTPADWSQNTEPSVSPEFPQIHILTRRMLILGDSGNRVLIAQIQTWCWTQSFAFSDSAEQSHDTLSLWMLDENLMIEFPRQHQGGTEPGEAVTREEHTVPGPLCPLGSQPTVGPWLLSACCCKSKGTKRTAMIAWSLVFVRRNCTAVQFYIAGHHWHMKVAVKQNWKWVLSSSHHSVVNYPSKFEWKNTDMYVKLGFEIVRKLAIFSAWSWQGRVAYRSWISAISNLVNLATTATTSSINCRYQNRPTCSLWVFYVLIALSLHCISWVTECRLYKPSVIWRR